MAPATAIARLNPTGLVPTSSELALSHYFHSRLKYACSDELNAELWQHVLPQTSHSVATIWHATNAFASSMWARDVGANLAADVVKTFEKESIKQHSICVRHLLTLTQSQHISTQDETFILLANIVLSQSGPESRAARLFPLLEMSHRLIRRWKFWQHIDSGPLSTVVVQVMLFWLKTEGMRRESLFLTPVKPAITWCEAIAYLQKRPFNSAVEAYIELQMIWSSVQVTLDGIPFQPTEANITQASNRRFALQSYFAAWELRYDTLLSSGCSISRPRLATLGARRNLLNVLFSIDLSRFNGLWDETCWDEFEPNFWSTFLLIESALPLNNQHESQVTPLLCNSLNFIARVCRTPGLRHRVATLLLASLRHSMAKLPMSSENDNTYYPIVNLIISLEEEGWDKCNEVQKCVRGEFICNMHRVARLHEERPAGTHVIFVIRTVGDILNGRHGLSVRPENLAIWS